MRLCACARIAGRHADADVAGARCILAGDDHMLASRSFLLQLNKGSRANYHGGYQASRLVYYDVRVPEGVFNRLDLSRAPGAFDCPCSGNPRISPPLYTPLPKETDKEI